MWISYQYSELSAFHPVCERALNAALCRLGKDHDYRVLHHQYTGTLEMDFAVQNTSTGNYLCVFEVKRTLSAVNSARYQYQAMSYVQMNQPISEKPYFVLTNLEYAYVFRYDAERPRVVQQMLKPGLWCAGSFADNDQITFEEALATQFTAMLRMFLQDSYAYLETLEEFESHMRNIVSHSRRWKSSLVVLLYEYIRGAFAAVGRQDLPYDVHAFRGNVSRICAEAVQVNFREIFGCSPGDYEPITHITPLMLSHLFDFGRQAVSGDAVADILHEIVSRGREHEGEVPTDLELARLIAILVKGMGGNLEPDEFLCDPAAGSGNLLSCAAEVFQLPPRQLRANDGNRKLLELLSLRIGLNYPNAIQKENSPVITGFDILELPRDYLRNVKVVVMNPPFVAGINCVWQKRLFFQRIKQLTGREAITNVGQMNLEGAFLELVCAYSRYGTSIACVLPKTHLSARGQEARAIRKLLIEKMGLQAVFSYPEEGLFENVTKGTCVVFGKIGMRAERVKFIASNAPVADLDLQGLGEIWNTAYASDSYQFLLSGIDGMERSTAELEQELDGGWRKTSRECLEAWTFIEQQFASHPKLQKLLVTAPERVKRGTGGNSGASDLVFLDRSGALYEKYRQYATKGAMRNAKSKHILAGEGDSAFFDCSEMPENVLESVLDEYTKAPLRMGRQYKAAKTREEYKDILRKEAARLFPPYSVLVPRLLRTEGKVYLSDRELEISTNFVVISQLCYQDAAVLASWMSTIFYQLICENSAKQQEGVRKMEVVDVRQTYVPIIQALSPEEKKAAIRGLKNSSFVKLNAPSIREIDQIWARVLFQNSTHAEECLKQARRLLEFIANLRNPFTQSTSRNDDYK